MTRQAFLAQMPDPLSPRPFKILLFPSTSWFPLLFFALFSSPTFLLFPSPFCVVLSLHRLCLFLSDDPLPLLLFLLWFSPASEVSRDRVGWSLYSYRLLVPYSRETCARSTMFGTFTTDNRKQTFMPLYLKREALTYRS